jgi:hypothetical protein
MAGLVTHVSVAMKKKARTWITGSSPVMTAGFWIASHRASLRNDKNN